MADDHARNLGPERVDVPSPGDVVCGKYVIDRELGEGGMGILFAATHRALHQKVAIKFLKSKYASEAGARERFLREARAAAAITSEHAARIQDVDETDTGLPFIVMELLDGTDLDRLLSDRKRIPALEAVGYVLEACEAIAEAHAAGIVHRDLKPSNLFLAERANGTRIVKVLDFGISKSILQDEEAPSKKSLTAPNTLLGSPQYMSPEQVRNAKTVDARSDVWALGVILYELIAGVPPFECESIPELYAKILASPPTPLRKVVSDAPTGLGEVVASCLAKDVDERVPSVGALAMALAPFAPAGSEARVDRITRALGRGPESTRARSSMPAPHTSPAVFAPTVAMPRRRGVRSVVMAAAFLSVVGVGVVAYRRAADKRVDGAQRAPLSASTSALASTLPSSKATPVNVPSSAPLPSSSASASASAGRAQRPPPVAGSGRPPRVKDISEIQLIP